MFNNRGSALMQVLLVTVIVATIATFILRLNLSRTTTAANTMRQLHAKSLMEACNSQVHAIRSVGGALPSSCTIDGIVIKVNSQNKSIVEDGQNITIQEITFEIDSDYMSLL
ncbi:Tfp pilus assembly protein PilX [Elusimicrobium simillimum]|uniref:hypothetical protein n=1 Tax=Elusimicrobium simillimum TaxID=3143438 RepID=UPI003C703A19